MAGYRFVTPWRLEAPRDAVWAVVDDVESWPRWWPGVTRAEVLPAPDGQRRLALRFRAALGYSLGFVADVVESAPPVRGRAVVQGELEGTARWDLDDVGGGTLLTWTWEVAPRVRWLRLVSPVARPVLAWAHADLMRRGRAGLARRLRATVPPPTPPRP